MPAGFFDSHALFTDIYEHPELYLNGTAPLNVTGAAHACVYELNESTSGHAVCTTANVTDQDSYLWYVALCLCAWGVPRERRANAGYARDRYDELHPSVQTERVVAQAIADVIRRKSEKWITWLR